MSRLASGKYNVRRKRMKFTYQLVLQSFISHGRNFVNKDYYYYNYSM
jgi:hypothetical protein